MTPAVREEDASDAADVSGTHRRCPEPGQLIGGKYCVEGLIAEGGMGLVLRATHLDLDCPVAIKLIRPEHAANEEVVARLLNEARIAAGLRSKHVNRVLDVGRTESGAPYLVLELLEGYDLGQRLRRRGPMSVTEAVDCVLQACEALAEAHALGIVHRDLKPDNLFLCEEADGSFVLKVLDFGISKAPAQRRRGRTLTNPFEIMGSPNYMAPEQIRGGKVDSRSDIWALGALLYELCSGDCPFAAGTVTETFQLIIDERYDLPQLELGPDSEHLQLVIERCLRRNADERFADVTELADALSVLGSDPLQGRRVAKVALSTRARIEAGADAPRATPIALSSSVREGSTSLASFPRAGRARLPWVLGAAAALSLSGLGWHFGTSGSTQRPASASAPAPLPPAPVETTEPVRQPPSVVALAPAPSQIAPPPATVARPRRAPSFRPVPSFKSAPVVSAPAPAPLVAPAPAPLVAPAVPAEPTVVPARSDAWDPKSFGGRR
jgi:serine/threonine protein kinase